MFILGATIGSFLNVCIYRIPREKSIVFPSSACTACGKKLTPIELIPLLSFILQKGRCKGCSVKVSGRYFLVELLVGLMFLAFYSRYSLSFEFFLFSVLSCILTVASFIDLEFMIIPNRLIIVGTAIVLPFVFFGAHIEMLDAFLGMILGGGFLAVVSLASLLILKKEGMGGGDIKMMAMAGLYLGLELTIVSFVVSIYLAAILIVVLFALKKLKRGDYIPFGPFLSIGVVISALMGDILLNLYLQLFL